MPRFKDSLVHLNSNTSVDGVWENPITGGLACQIPLIHTYRIVRLNSKYQPVLQMSELPVQRCGTGRIKHCLIQISCSGLLLDKKDFV